MRKEVLFAIVFGIVIGLVFAFGVFRVNNAVKNDASSGVASGDTRSDKENPSLDQKGADITLLRPSESQVFGDDMVQISGMTGPDSYVVTTGGTYDSITTSSPDGSFSYDYEVDPALNIVSITSITHNNNRRTYQVEVVYTSEVPAPENDLETQPEVNDRIEEKLEQAQNLAQFYKGTITDLTSSGLQMKTTSGEIEQVSITEETTYAKIAKTTTDITLDDVAIGDYILALGYRKGNGLLHAFRILVTQPEEFVEVKVFYGTVLEKNKYGMVIDESSDESLEIDIDNNTKTYEGNVNNPDRSLFANISEGDLVIGTYYVDDDENIARRIYILKGISD